MDSSSNLKAELIEHKEQSSLQKVDQLIENIKTQMILNRKGLEVDLNKNQKVEDDTEQVIAAKMYHMKKLYKMARSIRDQTSDRIQRVNRSRPDKTKSPSVQKTYKYECPLCEFKNVILVQVIDHVYQNHQMIYALTCPICKISANHTQDLVSHFVCHQKTKDYFYQCPFTDKQFTSKCDLRIHVRDTPEYFTLTQQKKDSKIEVLIEE